MRAQFERSDAMSPHFGGPKVVISEDYEWLQLTYNELRVAPDGDRLAYYNADSGVWWFENEAYSDVVITDQAVFVEEGSFTVTATLKTGLEFAPMERSSPLTVEDAIDNAKGTVMSDVWDQLADGGWSIEFTATRD